MKGVDVMQNNDESILKNYQKEYENVTMSEDAYRVMKARMEQGRKDKYLMKKKKLYISWIAATAAALTLIILPNTSNTIALAMGNIPVVGEFFKVVTFREYQYNDDRHVADVKVPEITVGNDVNNTIADTAKDTTDEINDEIKKLTDKWIDKFKANMEEEGYHNILIKSEVINTSENYFTLKLICFQAAGSGYEEHHYYTIDLNSGERVYLSDLFKEGSDYRKVISENIKAQMKEQMAADSNIIYWVDNKEYPEWNFKEIDEDATFYINADNEIVISFNEGEVAPSYMGVVEFVISNEVVSDMFK